MRAPPVFEPAPRPQLVLAALIAVYVAWGSTYLAIRIALTSFPPFLLSGLRSIVAGSLLLLWAGRGGKIVASRRAIANAALVGLLMVGGGNGLLTYGEQWVSSGLTAAIVASASLWLVVMLAILGEQQTRGEWIGIAIGFGGCALLNLEGEMRASPAGAIALLASTISWAVGAVLARRLELPPVVLLTGVELFAAGIVVASFGLATGERIVAARLTSAGVLAWLYLICAGSVVGFSSVNYLLRNVRPALATSFVYVNPVVAVLLGMALAGERISTTGLVGVIVSVVGLAVVTMTPRRAD